MISSGFHSHHLKGNTVLNSFEQSLVGVANDFADDYSLEDLFEEIFPGVSAGELLLDMYNAGLIPDDILERFLNDG